MSTPIPDNPRPAESASTREVCGTTDAEVVSSVYAQLRRLAAWYFRNEANSHTLQPTALVHEVFVKMAKEPSFGSRFSPERQAQFLGMAAHAMRQILVDHARAKKAVKRGGNNRRFTISDTDEVCGGSSIDVTDLHEAIERLSSMDPRAARVIELRFFAGLSIAQTAGVLGVSDWTVEQDWRSARAWLASQLGG